MPCIFLHGTVTDDVWSGDVYVSWRRFKEGEKPKFVEYEFESRREEPGQRRPRYGRGRYSSTKELLWNYIDRNSSQIWSAKRRAELDVRLGSLSAMLNLDREKKNKVSVPNSGGRFFTTGQNCRLQRDHKAFEVVAPGWNPGFFMIMTGREGSRLWTYPGSYVLLYYPAAVKTLLTSTLYMEQVSILPLSVFVGLWYLLHWGPERSGSNRLMYHVYFIPSSIQLKKKISFAYEDSMTIQVATRAN